MTVTAPTLVGGCYAGDNCRAATNYLILGSAGQTAANAITTEARVQSKTNKAGVGSKLTIRVQTHNSDAGGCVVQFRKNTANGNQTISVASNIIGEFTDATHTDSLAVADLVNLSAVLTNLANFVIGAALMEYDATSTTAVWFNSTLSGTVSVAAATMFAPLQGGHTVSAGQFTATETKAQTLMRGAGVLSRLGVFVQTNTDTAASTWTARANAGSLTNTISVGASGTTGYIEDTTHSDSITAGQKINAQYVSSITTSSIVNTLLASTYEYSTSSSDLVSNDTDGFTFSTTADQYQWFVGRLNPTTTLLNRRITLPFSVVTGNLRVNITTSSSGDCSFTMGYNGFDLTQLVSVPGTTTGIFEDTTHTDSLGVGGYGYYHYNHATSGTLTGAELAVTTSPSGTVVPPGSITGFLWGSGI